MKENKRIVMDVDGVLAKKTMVRISTKRLMRRL